MAKIIFRGWRKEPEEDWQQAYDVLTGRKKPFYVVFGRPETTSKQLVWFRRTSLESYVDDAISTTTRVMPATTCANLG